MAAFQLVLHSIASTYNFCVMQNTRYPRGRSENVGGVASCVVKIGTSWCLLENVNEASPDDGLQESASPLSRWGCKTGLPRIPSFIKQRLSVSSLPPPQLLKKHVEIEWSMSTGHVIAQIRGGSDSDSEEEVDESEEYDDEEEEDVDSSDDEYDSEEEYETESDDENEHDSDEEEEEFVIKASSSLKSSLLSKSQDSKKEIDYDDVLVPPAMQQFAVSIGVMLLSNRIDILDPKAVRIARFAFVAYIVSVQVFLLYVQLRAKTIDDRSPVKISNPLASLAQNSGIGGGGGNFMVKALADQVLSTQTTVLEYDLKQAKKMNGGLLFPMVFLYFLHFKMKQVQPLLMQTATGFLNLVYSPLFQVYVLGRNLERPFKPPVNPMMDAMQQQQQQGQEENGEGVEVVDAVSEEIGGEGNGDEEGDDGSEAEEEDASDEEEESEDDDDEYDSDEE